MPNDLIRLTAREAVARLRAKDITPLEMIDAAAARIAALSDDADRNERMRRSVGVLAAATFDMTAYVDRLDELGSRHAAGAAPRPT